MQTNSDIQREDFDKQLDYTLKKENEKRKLYIIIGTLILLFLFRGTISFWIKFGIAIPSSYETDAIEVLVDPIQTNYSELKKSLVGFEYKSLINGNKIQIKPQAEYNISGLVVAYNRSFLTRDDFFDSAALYDIGLVWGRLSDKKFYKKYFKCYSQKNEMTGARVLWTSAKTRDIPEIDSYYVQTHFSHTHIVPATRNVMAALVTLNVWDKVELRGELIDMDYTNPYTGKVKHYKTSMSRDDPPEGDNGYGSCETMYVTEVKKGHWVYK